MNEDSTPRLPVGDDPYEILGVARGTSEINVRRAYTRLIRVFRPDHSPDEFRRVRAAYEAILSDLAYERLFECDDDGEPPDGSEPRPLHEGHVEWPPAQDGGIPPVEPVQPWAGGEVWSVFETDGAEAAQAVLDRIARGAPGDLNVHAARFLLAEITGDERAFPDLAEALSKAPELSAWVSSVLTSDEQARLAGDAATTMQALQRQRDATSAIQLMRRRVDAMLQGGQVEEALAEASEPSVLQAARDDPDVASALLRVACAGAWSHPEQAAHLFERAMEGAAQGVHLEAAYDARVRMRPVFESWRDQHREAHDLIRLLTICDGLGALALEAERRRVAGAAHARPVLYLHAINSLIESDPELHVLFFEALGSSEDEALEDDQASPNQATIEAALRATDKAIDKDFGSKLHTGCFLGLIVLMFVLVAKLGAWGWAGLGLFVPYFRYVVGPADGRIYRDIVRPQLAKTVAHTGCTVADVLQALKAVGRPTDDIGRFKTEIWDDESLHGLVYLLRSGSA